MKNEKYKIIIEKLSLQDLNQFWQVFCQIIKQDFSGYSQSVVDCFLTRTYSQYNFQQWLMTGWKIVLVAKKEKEIEGFAVLDKPYGGVCFLRWLGVKLEYRKKGIGKKLLTVWYEYALNYGCHKIELAAQKEAKKFYQKAGLKLEGKRKLSYFGIDQYIFGKVIGKPKDEIMIKD